MESLGKCRLVRGKGNKTKNNYSFKVPLHSGVNKFRVTQTDNSVEKRISKEVTQESSIKEFSMTPTSVRDDIYSTPGVRKRRPDMGCLMPLETY